MKYTLTSRIAGAALAAFAAQNQAPAQELQPLQPHGGLLFNDLISWDQFKGKYPAGAALMPDDKIKGARFAADFYFAIGGRMENLAITCDALREFNADVIVKPYLSMLRFKGELNEMSEGITRGAIRGAAAACAPIVN